jgi:hypothetical protein
MVLHDVVIPFHAKDTSTISLCCQQLRNILDVKRIFLISWDNPNIENTEFINENDIDLVSYQYIKNIWENPERTVWNTGWIYQQLLKLSVSKYISDISNNFLVCDSDIFFTRNPYKNINDNVFPFCKTSINVDHKPYIYIYKDLMKENPIAGFSFINHHMIFNKFKLNELHDHIEKHNNKRWDYAIVDLLNFEHSFPATKTFSEYDLYGNWMLSHYPDISEEIKIKFQELDEIPTTLSNSTDVDIMSCQGWRRCSNDLLKFR